MSELQSILEKFAMLIQTLYYIGVFSFYLWFVWPFLFVFCLAYGSPIWSKARESRLSNWPWPGFGFC